MVSFVQGFSEVAQGHTRAGTGTGTGTGEIDLTCVHDSARGRAVQSVCQFDLERERRGFSNLVYGIWYAAFWGRR